MHRGPRPGTCTNNLQSTVGEYRMNRICILATHQRIFFLGGCSVREGEQGESEGRRVIRYPDAHQVFVGNVPHDVDKSELKEFFERKMTCGF